MKKHFNLGDIVYHVTDEMNEAQIIVGIVERVGYYAYITANKNGERENSYIELSTDKKYL